MGLFVNVSFHSGVFSGIILGAYTYFKCCYSERCNYIQRRLNLK